MAAPEGKQEKSSNQTAQQAGQTTRRAAQTAADVSGRAAAIGIEVVKRSNETAQHFWEASAQMATQLTHQPLTNSVGSLVPETTPRRPWKTRREISVRFSNPLMR